MTRQITRTITLACVLTLAVAFFSMAAGENRTFAIRDAKVYTMGALGVLPKATVVIVDGKIADVGPSAKIPAGAQIINGAGLEVYPGMINSWSNLGLTEIGAVPVTNDYSELGDYNPHINAFSAFHVETEHIPVARANGITANVSVPSGGVIPGQAALMHLDGWSQGEMAISRAVGMVIAFPSIGGRGGRGAGMGRGAAGGRSFTEARRSYERQVKELSEQLEQARHYVQAREANPATERDRRLEALGPVVTGQMPAFFQADTARDIRNAVEFTKKEKLKCIIQGGREANKVSDLLKKENVPVLLGSMMALPGREDDPYDVRYTVPRDLANAGVKFAVTSPSSSDVRNLPFEAGIAEAYGLPHSDALKSVTTSPAEILGVADRIGTIEKGKVADLVVTDGDLLELKTQVKNLFIAGKNVSLETKHTRLYKKYIERP
jgi:imidazolonepropionase-like amidohydrolase